MKTIEQLNKKISLITQSIDKIGNDPKSKSKIKKLKSELLNVKEMKLYLETNPSQQYLDESLGKLRSKLTTIEESFDKWAKNDGLEIDKKKQKPAFNKEFGVKQIKQQIKNIESIL